MPPPAARIAPMLTVVPDRPGSDASALLFDTSAPDAGSRPDRLALDPAGAAWDLPTAPPPAATPRDSSAPDMPHSILGMAQDKNDAARAPAPTEAVPWPGPPSATMPAPAPQNSTAILPAPDHSGTERYTRAKPRPGRARAEGLAQPPASSTPDISRPLVDAPKADSAPPLPTHARPVGEPEAAGTISAPSASMPLPDASIPQPANPPAPARVASAPPGRVPVVSALLAKPATRVDSRPDLAQARVDSRPDLARARAEPPQARVDSRPDLAQARAEPPQPRPAAVGVPPGLPPTVPDRPEPVVHIGRLEVRLVNQPQRVRSAPPTAPARPAPGEADAALARSYLDRFRWRP